MKHQLIAGTFFFVFAGLAGFNSTAQNVGIGTNTPTGPLSFANLLGRKIVLWGDGNAGHYGLGVQSGLLQIYSDAPSANISLGYGRSEAFTERIRIINFGGDGMILNGRLFIRNGTSPLNTDFSGGVWLYMSDNSALLGFMGTQNNQNIGFYGGPAGWGFTYDAINSRVGIGNQNPNAPLSFPAALGKKITLYPGPTGDVGIGVSGNRLYLYGDNPNADVAFGWDNNGNFNERFAVKPNGALAVVGNTGQPGQVLVSNGAGAAASWSTIPGGYLFVAAQSANSGTVGSGSGVQDIPGLTADFTLNAPSRVLFNFRVRVSNTSCFGCGERRGFVVLRQNIVGGTTNIASTSVYMPNGEFADVASGPIVLDLQPGSYSFKLVLENSVFGSQNMIASTGGFSRLTWQIFPL